MKLTAGEEALGLRVMDVVFRHGLHGPSVVKMTLAGIELEFILDIVNTFEVEHSSRQLKAPGWVFVQRNPYGENGPAHCYHVGDHTAMVRDLTYIKLSGVLDE